ncbi:MAG: hypothetical protein JWM33_334 [Caulobacteraceae bacterium]|nr:hypothetical protein [Caulobacteraceae bacterium]
MSARHRHDERHFLQRIGWLRATVLGANDGILSTASLTIGVASSGASHGAILIAALAALVGGAGSMAAGEYVSVSSQADSEKADIERERGELAAEPEAELRELIGIYRHRGLDRDLAEQVARQMTAHGALEAHLRDELGITAAAAARPLQAAFASASSFAGGALLPLAAALAAPQGLVVPAVALCSLAALAGLGALGARLGGAPLAPASIRVTVWGALAMAATALLGHMFGAGIGA